MWFQGPIQQALERSKKEQLALLTFIKGDNDDSAKMTNILDEDGFKNSISDSVVALKFEENSDNAKLFNEIYPIKSVPVLYLIASNASILDTISGSIEKSDLINKINVALAKQKTLRDQSSTDQSNGDQTPEDSSQSLKRANESPIKVDVKEKEKHAQERIKEIRAKKAKEEEQRALDMEKERIRTGKEIQTAKEIQREKEMQELVKQRQREKLEEKRHKERVLLQIKQDQEDRKARQNFFESKPKPLVISQPSKITSDQTRLQLRLPDSSTIKSVFNIKDTLRTVVTYIEDNTPQRGFKLSTNFPAKEFKDEDLDKTLLDLKLAPSACLIVKVPPVPQAYSTVLFD